MYDGFVQAAIFVAVLSLPQRADCAIVGNH